MRHLNSPGIAIVSSKRSQLGLVVLCLSGFETEDEVLGHNGSIHLLNQVL